MAEGTERIRVAVIGLGYVGLPLATALAAVGHTVVGVDVNAERVRQINQGQNYIPDVSDEELAELVAVGRLRATTDYDALREVEAIFICVPTPLDAMRAPDLSYIVKASEGIARRLQPGHLVILQSTTYPGTTEEVVLPILERSGLKAGVDFNLAFSPERLDPGQTGSKGWNVANTPKVVGGLTPQCTERAADLLASLGAPVHLVSAPRVAEMTKMLENIYRSVNIALVNELALLAERMQIDFWEVIEAARTKPFGFMPFYPGAGVGGHCIPVDPYYLSWKAREYDFYTKFIELAAEVNQAMPFHVVELIGQGLGRRGRALRDARVLVVGVAFKADVDDARNSPAQRVMELLLTRGAHVAYHDPYVPQFSIGGNVFYREKRTFQSLPLTDQVIRQQDCVVIVTGHHSVDYGRIVRWAPLVVDSCNATARVRNGREKIIRLGTALPR